MQEKREVNFVQAKEKLKDALVYKSKFEDFCKEGSTFEEFVKWLESSGSVQHSYDSVVDLLLANLHFYSLGRQEGKSGFLSIIEDLNNKGCVFEDDGAYGTVAELFEVLFTLREYDLLNAVFACDEIPKPPKEQVAALKKAIRLADGRLIQFLMDQGIHLASIDKKSIFFSLMKGIQQAGRTRNIEGREACGKIFLEMYDNPQEDLPLIRSALSNAIRNFHFTPRMTQSHLKLIRDNTFLIQFFRCYAKINLQDLALEDELSKSIHNYQFSIDWQSKKTSKLDIRIHGSMVDKGKYATQEFDEELLYYIDILVSGGVPRSSDDSICEELFKCLNGADKTRLVCGQFAADPVGCTELWFSSSIRKESGPDVVSLIFQYLGSF